jgi:hypothetical protein
LTAADPRKFGLPTATDDHEAQLERWRHSTEEERGRALVELLDFVDAVGNFPRRRDEFPGWKKIWRERKGQESSGERQRRSGVIV